MCADYFEKSRHHLSITDFSTADVLGFVLAKGDKGQLLYSEHDGKFLADQFFTDAATQANLDPEKELLLGQSDWRSGFGLTLYDPNEPKRYESSYGADMRSKDRATLSYGATSIALSLHTASDWNLPNNHLDSGGVWTDETKAYDNNTATYAHVTPGLGLWSDYLYLFIPVMSCSQIRYWWSEQVDTAVGDLEIAVYYGGAWNIVVSDDSQGEGAYATASLGATRTVYGARIRMQDSGAGGELRLNELQFYATSATAPATVGKGKTFNDVEYIPIANALYKLNGTGDGFTAVKSFPNAITSLEPMIISGTDYLFIALGLADTYWYMTAAEAVTQSTATVNTFQFFQTVYTTALTMYGNDTNSTIRSTTNPLNGGTAWSASATQVDSDLYDITELKSKSGALYIAKENMPFYLSSTGAVQKDLAPELEALTATTSGKNGDIWLDKWYYPAGSQALLEIGDSNTWRTPAEFCAKQADFNGKVAAVTHDDRWLWALLNNTTKVEVMCGRLETIDGTTSWVWHPYKELTMGNCNTSWVSSVYQKRLWIASATAGEALQYIPLPTGYGDLTSDANRSFATGGYFTTPFLHGNFKETTKGLISVSVSLGHAYDVDIYWECHYKKLGDSTWTDMGDMKGTATDRTHTLYRTTSTSSPMVQFKLVGVTDDTTKTPELLSYIAKLIMYPSIKKLIFCTVRVGDGVADKAGLTMSNKTVLQKTCLDNARNATWLVTFTDLDGTSRKGKFLPLPSGTPRRVPVKDEKGRTVEYEYNLLIMVVETS